MVVRAGLTVSSSLLDEPLSRSARTVGWNLTAWQHVPGSGWRVRSAAPDGSVATGAGEPDRELTELLRTPPPGAVVFHASRRPPRGELSRLDAEQQRARRLEATVRGISVDTAVWQRLGDLAQNFLLRDD